MITFKNKYLKAGSVCCGIAAALLAMPLFTSCSDFFETDSDRQIFEPALDEKTDSMFYTLGILKGLQQVADQYVLTGEMRGDLVAVNGNTETDLQRLADFTADATCKYDSAYKYYRIINNCNYYLAHRDTTLLTGSRKVAIPEYAEALAVRAWSYLQLAKTYGEVPFYTDPLTSIGDANSNIPTKDLQGIVDALTPEMMKEVKGSEKVVCANVDMYSGLVYRMLGIPQDLFTPLFAVSRMAGWCAHRFEEINSGKRIIRPAYKSVSHEKKYVDIKDR